MNYNKFYHISYQQKGKHNVEKMKALTYDEFSILMRQLKKCAASFDGNVILGIDSLEYFKIEEKNYISNKDNLYKVQHNLGIETNTGEQLVEEESLEYPEEFHKSEKDITQQALYDFGISGEDYKKKGNIILEIEEGDYSYLYVDGYKEKFENGSQGLKLMKLLLTAQETYKRTTFTYDELKHIYSLSEDTYRGLPKSQIGQIEIGSFFNKKKKKIQDKLDINEDWLKVTVNNISIWQEMAI